MYLNQHTVVGFLAADVEVVQINRTGDPPRYAINFRIAATKRTTINGETKERTTWFSVKRYMSSETGVEYYRSRLLQGAEVFVQGEHLIDEREGANGAKSRYAYIEADRIEVLRDPRKKKDESGAGESDPPFGEQLEEDVSPTSNSRTPARSGSASQPTSGQQAPARSKPPTTQQSRNLQPSQPSESSEFTRYHDFVNW